MALMSMALVTLVLKFLKIRKLTTCLILLLGSMVSFILLNAMWFSSGGLNTGFAAISLGPAAFISGILFLLGMMNTLIEK